MSDLGGYKLDLSTVGDDQWVVSTGHLPISAAVRAEVESAYDRFREVRDGTVPSYYPALSRVNPDLFGIAVTATSGEVFPLAMSPFPSPS